MVRHNNPYFWIILNVALALTFLFRVNSMFGALGRNDKELLHVIAESNRANRGILNSFYYEYSDTFRFWGNYPFLGDIETAKNGKFKELNPDSLTIEPYDFHPNAFLDWIYITMALMLTGIIMATLQVFFNYTLFGPYWSLIILILVGIGFFIAYGQFLGYREFVDFLFPKATAENIAAIFNPSAEKRAILIVSGHHDSAREFWLIHKFKQLYIVFVLASMLLLFIITIFAIWNVIWSFLFYYGVVSLLSWVTIPICE